jgi:hypothetical protein
MREALTVLTCAPFHFVPPASSMLVRDKAKQLVETILASLTAFQSIIGKE